MQVQASGFGQTKIKLLGETSSTKVTSHPGRPSAPPHPASPAATGAELGCSSSRASPDDSPRGALPSLPELGHGGPPPGVFRDGTGGVGPAGLDPPGSTMWKGKKGEQRPCVWTDEKDVKYNRTSYRGTCAHDTD